MQTFLADVLCLKPDLYAQHLFLIVILAQLHKATT